MPCPSVFLNCSSQMNEWIGGSHCRVTIHDRLARFYLSNCHRELDSPVQILTIDSFIYKPQQVGLSVGRSGMLPFKETNHKLHGDNKNYLMNNHVKYLNTVTIHMNKD